METATEKSGVRTMSFYTLGPEFTNLVRMLIEEGSFIKAYTILNEGGLPQEAIKSFFLYELRFHGDTRTEEGLFTIPETEKFDLKDIYATAIATCLSADGFDSWEWKEALNEERSFGRNDRERKGGCRDFKNLFNIFTEEEIVDFAAIKLLARYGYHAKEDQHGTLENDGVILRDGTYIPCGFQDHINLFPILFQLGLSSGSDWTRDDMVIHVSSGTISGKIANCIDHPKSYWDCEGPTEKQVNSLFFFKSHIKGEYGGGIHTKTSAELCRSYIKNVEDHGGKYNNLVFLKRFYPEIKLPEFSKEKMKGKVCIRTSPKYSMPGLLNSIFDVKKDSIQKIKNEFKEIIKLTGKEFKDNELHYFYQEYLEGDNGVCHYWEKGKFTYAYSDKRGDTVKGIKSNKLLPLKLENKLRKIASTLFEDLDNPVQLEFVIKDNEVYIVQLRLLENNYSNHGVVYKPDGKVLVGGKTFSTGYKYGPTTHELELSDILIVDSDADSKELIGKKALIVKSNVEFSHILALSKALAIPSMFATGEIDLNKLKGKLNFVAQNEDAWITAKK